MSQASPHSGTRLLRLKRSCIPRIPSSSWSKIESLASGQVLGCSSFLCVMWFAVFLSLSISALVILCSPVTSPHGVCCCWVAYLGYGRKFLPDRICCYRKKSAKTFSDERLYFPFAQYFQIWHTWGVMSSFCSLGFIMLGSMLSNGNSRSIFTFGWSSDSGELSLE